MRSSDLICLSSCIFAAIGAGSLVVIGLVPMSPRHAWAAYAQTAKAAPVTRPASPIAAPAPKVPAMVSAPPMPLVDAAASAPATTGSLDASAAAQVRDSKPIATSASALPALAQPAVVKAVPTPPVRPARVPVGAQGDPVSVPVPGVGVGLNAKDSGMRSFAAGGLRRHHESGTSSAARVAPAVTRAAGTPAKSAGLFSWLF